METTTLSDILATLDKGGTVACLILFAIGGVKGWWVYGHHYLEMVRQRDDWKALATRGHRINQQAIEAVDHLVKQ